MSWLPWHPLIGAPSPLRSRGQVRPDETAFAENAIVHHGRLDPGVLLLAKPYRKSDLARMIRTALDN